VKGENLMKIYNPEDWYSGAEAAAQLSKNSGRPIDQSYVRRLAKDGLVTTLKLGPRYSLYDRKFIDNYIVETRGQKAGRAMHEKREAKERMEA